MSSRGARTSASFADRAIDVVRACLVASVLGLGRLIRPSRPSVNKLTTYESGVDPIGSGFSQSQIRYYIFALLFVLFDVEAVFIFPWAMGLETYSVFGLVEMGTRGQEVDQHRRPRAVRRVEGGPQRQVRPLGRPLRERDLHAGEELAALR